MMNVKQYLSYVIITKAIRSYYFIVCFCVIIGGLFKQNAALVEWHNLSTTGVSYK